MDTNSLPSTIVIPAVCAFGAVVIYWLGKPRLTPGIPHPPAKWLTGHILDLIAADKSGLGPTMLFNQYAEKYGPVTQFSAGPHSNIVLISDPQEVDVCLAYLMSDPIHSNIPSGYLETQGK